MNASNLLPWLSRSLLLLAIGLCAYLSWVGYSHSSIVGCGNSSGCDAVLQSHWSHSFRVPVSVPAGIAYILLEILSFVIPHRRAHGLVYFLGMAVILGALWMVVVQVALIHSLCTWCMTTHIVGVLGITLLFATIPSDGTSKWQAIGWGFAAILPVAYLIVGQYSFQRPTVEQITTSHSVQSSNWILLADGKIRLDVNDAPVIGNPHASHVIVVLFDYTCPHCRELHPRLIEAQKHFDGQLAMLMLPTPLCKECISTMKESNPPACNYARIALAVWVADKSAFAQFDQFMYSTEHLPDVSDAEAFAQQLVGAGKLESALKDPAIERLLGIAGQAYTSNNRRLSSDTLPQIIVGKDLIHGMPTQQQLQSALEKSLNLSGSATKP